MNKQNNYRQETFQKGPCTKLKFYVSDKEVKFAAINTQSPYYIEIAKTVDVHVQSQSLIWHIFQIFSKYEFVKTFS